MQDAFIALLRRAGTFSGAAAFSTWMFRVATNACNDLARKRSRRPRSSGGGVEQLDQTAAVEDLLANRELGLELEAALTRLDTPYRDAVVLHDVAGLPHADIAQRLGVPIGTVKSRIHRGHGQLAATLAHLREPTDRSRPPTVQP